jgi:methionyl-tRNA formyltransferase
MRTIIATGGELGFLTLITICSEIDIKGVLTDYSSTKVIDWAKERNIPLFIGNPRKGNFTTKVEFLVDIDILISINYLFIFEKRLIALPKIVSMNIHGGKLPLYRGRAPHIQALINGEKEVGVTLHKIDEGCDTGDIILQRVLELSNVITGGEILSLFTKIYPEMILEALSMIRQNSLKFSPQEHKRATYYEKRKPEENEINWDWNSIQIYNFVRALTFPYPGAFTRFMGKKIIIWKVEIISETFNSNIVNGVVLAMEGECLKMKVSDGVIKITHYTFFEGEQINITTGDRFMMEAYGK